MPPTATEIIEEIRTSFEQFRAQNDRRLAEVEAAGAASAETVAAVERANTDIATIQDSLEALRTAQEADRQAYEDLETRMNRPRVGGRGRQGLDDERIEHYAAWQGAMTGEAVDPAHVDLDMIASYTSAFNEYSRLGPREVSAETLETLRTANAHAQRYLAQLQVGSDTDGGYFVDPDTTGRIVQYVHETSPIRQRTTPRITPTSPLEGQVRLGRAGSGWVGEHDARTETGTPQVFEWAIPMREQYSEPWATQRQLDWTGFDVGAWLEAEMRDDYARQETTAFIAGNGAKRPRGLLTYPAGVPGETIETWARIQQVPSGHATALTADGIIQLTGSLKDQYARNAVMAGRRATETQIRLLKDGTGNYLWQPDFADGRRSTVAGVPFERWADLPAVQAGALPLVYGDIGEAYQPIDSPVGIRVLRDPYTTKGKVKFYGTRYVGGDVVNFEAVSLQVVSAGE